MQTIIYHSIWVNDTSNNNNILYSLLSSLSEAPTPPSRSLQNSKFHNMAHMRWIEYSSSRSGHGIKLPPTSLAYIHCVCTWNTRTTTIPREPQPAIGADLWLETWRLDGKERKETLLTELSWVEWSSSLNRYHQHLTGRRWNGDLAHKTHKHTLICNHRPASHEGPDAIVQLLG